MRIHCGVPPFARFTLWLLLVLAFAGPLRAAEATADVESRLAQLEAKAAAAPAINSGDNSWLLVSSALF